MQQFRKFVLFFVLCFLPLSSIAQNSCVAIDFSILASRDGSSFAPYRWGAKGRASDGNISVYYFTETGKYFFVIPYDEHLKCMVSDLMDNESYSEKNFFGGSIIGASSLDIAIENEEAIKVFVMTTLSTDDQKYLENLALEVCPIIKVAEYVINQDELKGEDMLTPEKLFPSVFHLCYKN